MTFQSSPVGNEISCVMHGLDEKVLKDNEMLKNLLLEALEQEKFTLLDNIFYEFQPQGCTVLVLLAESHAGIHTYPEHNSLFFYIYSCRGPTDGRKTFEYLKQKLNPSSVDYKERTVIVKQGHKLENQE